MSRLIANTPDFAVSSKTSAHMQYLLKGNSLFIRTDKLIKHDDGFFRYRRNVTLGDGDSYGSAIKTLCHGPTGALAVCVIAIGITLTEDHPVSANEGGLRRCISKKCGPAQCQLQFGLHQRSTPYHAVNPNSIATVTLVVTTQVELRPAVAFEPLAKSWQIRLRHQKPSNSQEQKPPKSIYVT